MAIILTKNTNFVTMVKNINERKSVYKATNVGFVVIFEIMWLDIFMDQLCGS